MNWAQETFAYAEDHDGDKWVGVQNAQHVAVTAGGLLIEPDFYLASVAPEIEEPGDGCEDEDEGGKPAGPGTGTGPAPDPPDKPEPPIPSVTQFYAQFDLDSVRGIKQLGQILENVSARLGSKIELSLEIRATNPDGYDDATQRIVSENASNLGASASEFE